MQAVLSIMLWASSILPFLSVRNQVIPGAVQLALIVCLVGLAWRRRLPQRNELVAFALAWLALYLVWAIWGVRISCIVSQLVVAGMCAFILFFSDPEPVRSRPRSRRVVYWSCFALCTVLEIAIGMFMGSFVDADILAAQWMVENQEALEVSVEKRTDGTTVTSNVEYGLEYPNSYLDVYRTQDSDVSTPTLIYVHGGGYVFGDKLFGDPTSGDKGGFYVYLQTYLDAGYNIVSIDYAHPPAYRYPTPVIQLSEAVRYLRAHANELGLNMSNVVFAAGNAGGNIAGQYVLTQVDADYASEMGIAREFEPGEIRAVAFNCAVFDNELMSDTDNAFMDYGADICARAYFGVSDLSRDPGAGQSNLVEHAVAAFPPCYVDDGTEYTFDVQAQCFADTMAELGVECELHIFEGQAHSFDTTDSAAARENLALQVAFTDRFCKGAGE